MPSYVIPDPETLRLEIRDSHERCRQYQARFTFEDIIGVSPAIRETKKRAMVAALESSHVLLLGETGTGKERFAHAIHTQSNRSGHPFLIINCAAVPRELLESELFGYVKGGQPGALKDAPEQTPPSAR